jgi:hypothetical protein
MPTLTHPHPVAIPETKAMGAGAAGHARMETISDAAWDEAIATHPDAAVFHSSAWSRVLKASYGIEPVRLAPGGNAFLALHEVKSWLTGTRGVCAPFADACPALVPGGKLSATAFAACVELAKARGWRHLEFRGGTMEHLGATPSCRFFQHTLDLRGGETALFDGLSGATRRNIRKAQRSDLTVTLETDEQAVHDYYRLHVGTRAKHGAPPQPESFFLNVWRECVASGNGFIALARRRGRPLAGAVFLKWRARAVFKFGASDESEQELRPSNLVMWEAIRALAARGCSTLDFGRTSMEADGLRRFKAGWGAVESELRYWRYDVRDGRWVVGADRAEGWQAAVFRRMPAFLQKQIGAALYRHLD